MGRIDPEKLFPYLKGREGTYNPDIVEAVVDRVLFHYPSDYYGKHTNIAIAQDTDGDGGPMTWVTLYEEDLEAIIIACQYILKKHYNK